MPTCPSAKTGRRFVLRHEQKDGGMASDVGVAELFFALGTGPALRPFMPQAQG